LIRRRSLKPYAIQNAVHFVEQNMGQGKWQPGALLPSLAELALMAGVSSNTMWKAMEILKERRLVIARKGCRSRAAGGNNADVVEKPAQHRSAPDRVGRMIEHDILNGRYHRGAPLASVKELQSKYGACHTTVRKALENLCRHGIIVPYKKGFQIPRIEKSQYRNSICLVWEVDSHEEFKNRSERENQIIDTLERECAQAGIALHFIKFNLDNPEVVGEVFKRLKMQGSAIGFFLHPIAYAHSALINRRYAELIARCAVLERPIAVIDELGLFKPAGSAGLTSPCRVFPAVGPNAGKRMARFLLGLGHTRIAYVSQYHHEPWSKERLEGIAREYARAGFPDAVSVYSIEHPDATINAFLKQPGLTEKQQRLLFPDRPEDGDIPSDFETLTRQFIPYLHGRSKEIERLKADTLILAQMVDKNMTPRTFRDICSQGMWRIGQDLLRILMGFLFEKALADRSITAWAVSNDNAALLALSYLRERGVRVPRDLSVVGFDNLARASEAGLTSFEFDTPNLVRQALGFVTRPGTTNKPFHGSPIDIEGIVMQRSTTASVKIR
jgi:DNA-binding transcriptional regulator YhcF (GntR family)